MVFAIDEKIEFKQKIRFMEKLKTPENLDLEELERNCPTNFAGYNRDKIRWVCNAIYQNSNNLNPETLTHVFKKDKYFVPLHTDIVSNFLGPSYYKNILQWMIDAGIIESDNSYQSGVVSIGYRFCEKYRLRLPKMHPVKKFTMSNKLKNIFTEQTKICSRTIKKLSKGYEYLELDCDFADIINASLHGEGMFIDEKGLGVIEHSDERKRLRYLNDLITIDLYRGNLSAYYKQDNFGNRLHTPITRLPRRYRSLVRYNGLKLAQTDLSNSQLFFSLCLLDEKYWKQTKANKFIWDGVSIRSSLDFFSIMSLKSYVSPCDSGFQDTLFFKLVTSGTIYDYYLEKMAKVEEFFADNITDKRGYIKKLLISQVNGDEYSMGGRPLIFSSTPDSKGRNNRLSEEKQRSSMWLYSSKKGQLWDAFKEDHPTIASVYKHLKAYDYADLAKVLQRIESHAILEVSCKRILKELGDIPLFPLHDCLVTTVDLIKDVDLILKESLKEYVGVSPNTEIKLWDTYADLIPHEFKGAA
jgi:hypothetical protein